MNSRFLITDHDFRNLYSLLNRSSEATVYHQKAYVDILAEHLEAESFYIGVFKGEKLVGAMPFILKRSPLGNIINSNPYFGSHGGPVSDDALYHDERMEAKFRALIFFNQFAKDNCLLSTIVTSPFDRYQDNYFSALDYTYIDERLTQITVLDNRLFTDFSESCRRSIRKSHEFDLHFDFREDENKLDEFYPVYHKTMEAMNRPTIDKELFKKLIEFEDLDTYIDSLFFNDKMIAGIFFMDFKNTTWYIAPAILFDYRHTQAGNRLVYERMEMSESEGKSYFNFGGTPKDNHSLYRFKRSFSAIEFPYYYFTMEYGDTTHILNMNESELKEAYPGFYVVPYTRLRRN
jgi:hypothetical protein